jgi:hypothetical protein
MNSKKSKILHWTAMGLGSFAVLGLIAVGVIYLISTHRMNQSFAVPQHPVPIPSDTTAITYGEHLSRIRGCTECHGENLAGGVMIDDPMVARLYTSNLTPGKGGIGGFYTDADWERAIRHGVGPDGKPLIYMPAQEFFHLSDKDLGALIAYLKSLPPVDNELPTSTIGPVGRLLYIVGEMPLIPAELTNHTANHPTNPAPGVTVEYGKYLAVGCMGCHGQDFSGGPIPGAPSDWPPAADLTPSGNLKHWSEGDFIQAVRTGIKPNGRTFSPYMPYRILNAMTDEELKALWMFFKSLPAR